MINVQGTSAVTNVTTNDGDDRVYVSSLAAYGLDDHPAYLAGDLNPLAGNLNLDLGAGRHTLMISDEAATAGDANVRITRVADAISVAGLAAGAITYRTSGNIADGITIWTGSGNDTILVDATLKTPGVRTVTFLNTGLGNDAVTVDLSAADDDVLVLNTQGGVQQVLTIAGGLASGDDHGTPGDAVSVSVDGVLLDPSTYVVDRATGTVKLLSAPSPSSVITVTVRHFTVTGWTVAAGVILATSTRTQTYGAPQAPSVTDNDTVHAETSTLPLFIFGGQGDDTIFGGSGGDVIFGDRGVVKYGNSEFGHGGLGDRTDGIARGVESAQTADPAVGGNDTITAQGGDDVIFGGSGADTIVAGDGVNVVLGDGGSVVAISNGLTPLPQRLASVTTTTPTFGGADRITSGAGNDLILSGAGGDTIVAGDGDDIVLGDHGALVFGASGLQFVRTSDFNDGGSDRLEGGAGDDVLVGGAAGDAIDGDTGADLIFGDQVSLEKRVGDATSLRYQGLLGSLLYGADLSAQLDGLARGAGTASWMSFKVLDLFHTTAIAATAVPAGKVQTYGDDYITGGAGDDMVFGQLGNDVILGDGALEDPQAAAARLPGANDPLGALLLSGAVERLTDGDDYVEGGGGDDVIFGGLGQDDLIGGSSNLFTLVRADQRPDGSDYIFGGAGTRTAANSVTTDLADPRATDADAIVGDNGDIVRVLGATFTSDPGIVVRAISLLDGAGADEIHGEAGDDTIYGGSGADRIFGDADNDEIVGGLGTDWISGGSGNDGILGDEGRVYRYLAGSDEPLYGIGLTAGSGAIGNVLAAASQIAAATT